MNEQVTVSNTDSSSPREEPIQSAVLLAAGMGRRLKPLSNNTPKCLTMVNDLEILGRLVHNLIANDFNKLTVIVGHCHEQIRSYLDVNSGTLQVDYVYCPDYSTTNNIVSLWTARHAIRGPFVMFEGDLLFDSELLKDMLLPGRIAISERLPWMNGTTVTVNHGNENIEKINIGSHALNPGINDFKTVNIYSFSSDQWKVVSEKLNEFVGEGMVNEYYETVFAELVNNKELKFKPVFFDNLRWYEVDTLQDLEVAEKMFTSKEEIMVA
jgi:choline kinase